jgi:hypothetical protein
MERLYNPALTIDFSWLGGMLNYQGDYYEKCPRHVRQGRR